MNPFTALSAKISMGVNVALLIALIFVLVSKNGEIRGLDNQINNPKTGYKVQLAKAQSDLSQCRTNNATLSGAIDRQSGSIRAMEAKASAQAAAAAKDLATIRQQGAQQTTKLNNVLSGQAKGNTACERAEYIVREVTRP